MRNAPFQVSGWEVRATASAACGVGPHNLRAREERAASCRELLRVERVQRGADRHERRGVPREDHHFALHTEPPLASITSAVYSSSAARHERRGLPFQAQDQHFARHAAMPLTSIKSGEYGIAALQDSQEAAQQHVI